MEIIRAKTIDLKITRELSEERKNNSLLNEQEARTQSSELSSYPRRLVFELTNACNLNCIMCGRNAAEFKSTSFDIRWLDFFTPITSYVEEVTLMGWGEPTVHPHFVKFLEWASNNGLRKYFCTNGMRLDRLFEDIFKYETELMAVSLDGATSLINDSIRHGSKIDSIILNLKKIINYKNTNNLNFPYINFVFTAMKRNIHELPLLIELAANIGVDEVKVVYLTAFSDEMKRETLFHNTELVRDIFDKAIEVAKRRKVWLKLPHLPGEDPAGSNSHKTCYTAWRDMFLGSDGFIRPCMSTPDQFFKINQYRSFQELWNSNQYIRHRLTVNTPEMSHSCSKCYQSSFANWNKLQSFVQTDEIFSPQWSNF